MLEVPQGQAGLEYLWAERGVAEDGLTWQGWRGLGWGLAREGEAGTAVHAAHWTRAPSTGSNAGSCLLRGNGDSFPISPKSHSGLAEALGGTRPRLPGQSWNVLALPALPCRGGPSSPRQ